jgi:hypothetical protein
MFIAYHSRHAIVCKLCIYSVLAKVRLTSPQFDRISLVNSVCCFSFEKFLALKHIPNTRDDSLGVRTFYGIYMYVFVDNVETDV